MTYLIAQIALWLLAVGLLGLVLGWWLGRSSAAGRIAEAESGWQSRVAQLEEERAHLASGRTTLEVELAEAREARESAEKRAAIVASNLLDSEQQQAGVRRQLDEELESRDTELRNLRGEIDGWRNEVHKLQGELAAVVERADSDQTAVAARQRIAELEAALARSRQQLSEIQRTRVPDGDVEELRSELRRLRKVKAEFQEWMLGEAQREEELGLTRRRLEESLAAHQVTTAELAQVRVRLDSEQQRIAGIEAESETTGQLRDTLAARDGRIADLEAHIAAKAGLEAEVSRLRSQLASREERIGALDDELRAARERAEAADAAHRSAEERAEAADAAHRSAEERAEAADAAHRGAQSELEALRSDPLAEVVPARTVTIDDRDDASTEDRRSEPELLEAPRGASDDLKKIRGIGKVLEKTLNRLGVYHYRQIADWTPDQVQWIASHINTFPDRIERDQWIEQAAELAEG